VPAFAEAAAVAFGASAFQFIPIQHINGSSADFFSACGGACQW
jgi:hypothetical protein